MTSRPAIASAPAHRPRNVLVTGGAGFIGSHVAERFRDAGCDVTIVDDLSTGRRERIPAGVRFVRMELGDPALGDVFAEGRFDVVDHHAAQIDVRASVADPALDARSNVLGLLNLLERAREAGVARVVFASSGGVVYGEARSFPTAEDHPCLPTSPYGVAKLAGELYLRYYGEVHGLQPVSLRYANVYGPRQDPHGEAGVVAIFGRRILARRPITIFGDGTQERDYVYVGDVVEANWLAATAPLPAADRLHDRGWNVGTSRGTSVNELASRIEAVAGRAVERRLEAERPGEVARSVLAIDRIGEALGWRPATSLDEGLARTLDHLGRSTRTS